MHQCNKEKIPIILEENIVKLVIYLGPQEQVIVQLAETVYKYLIIIALL